MTILILSIAACLVQAATVSGILREKGTRKPIPAAEVYLLPSEEPQITDDSGKFEFKDIPAGSVEWVVNLAGYHSYRMKEALDPSIAVATKSIFVERTSYDSFETQIHAKKDRRDDSVHVLTAKEFYSMPGANGDPIKAVQNLPGVHRIIFGPIIIIEGSSPKDTRYLLEGHEVPLSVHFLGTSAVLMPEAVERVEYYSAGYGPTYGRAMGGLVGVWSRPPKTDRFHGLAFADIFNAGAMLEGPVGEKSSFMIGGRRSYIDGILGLVMPSDSSTRFAPFYADATLLYETELTPIDRFRLLAVGSTDEMNLLNNEEGDGIEFQYVVSYVRVIPQLTHRHSPTTTSTWSVAGGWEHTKSATGTDSQESNALPATARVELDHQANESWRWHLGADYKYTSGDVRSFFGIPVGVGTAAEFSGDFSEHMPAIYWLNTIRQPGSRWTLLPGARVDYFSSTKELYPAPRMGVRYNFTEFNALRAAGGLYFQSPNAVDLMSTQTDTAPRAWHASAGWERDFRDGASSGFTLTTGGFYRRFYKLTENWWAGLGDGRAFGWVQRIQYQHYPWRAALGYTLSRSTRWDEFNTEYPFEFDQTHNLNLLLSVDLPRNWKISSRFRFVSGNRLTPYIGSETDDSSGYRRPLYGEKNSRQLSPFMQLDLRFDKQWIYDGWILSGYLDIQNVLNRQNVEFVQPAPDYSSDVEITGLPIIPSLGFKAEF